MARRQLMESLLAPKSTAIPQQEIASYPQEWCDGACSSKYSHIPSYQGWCRGNQPVLARSEQATQFRLTERPLSPVPGPSTQAEPIEQPTFEGPRWSSRVRQQRQRPDNVYGDDPFINRLTDSQWDQIMAGQIPRPSDPETKEKANLLCSYVSHQRVSTQSALESELVLDLLLEEGGDSLRNFLLAAAKRSPPTLNGKTIEGEIELPDPSHIREWTYQDILRFPGKLKEEWRQCCLNELSTLKERKVFDLVSLPEGKKAIRNRWVFNIKPDGRKCAHLVAKGFSQIEGIDYEELFSPVVRYESVRIIFALTALEHWHLEAVDVKTAFLYGKLDEEIYMQQPEGFVQKGHKKLVL